MAWAVTALLAFARPALAADSAAAGGLPVVDGTIRTVDLAGHTLTVDADGEAVTLGLDRNTLVYLPTGLATVSALAPGQFVRAGRDDGFIARWVEVRSAPSRSDPAPPTPVR
jgi:hypothetical protein